LPPNLGLSDFRTHFSTTTSSEKPLTITDAKLPTKKNGTFRRFGFIGYKSKVEAERAKNWFDGTFFGTCKIHVELVPDEVIDFKIHTSKSVLRVLTGPGLIGTTGQEATDSKCSSKSGRMQAKTA
jgi:hypothetical protein